MLELLLENGASVAPRAEVEPLRWALYGKKPLETMALLLKRGARDHLNYITKRVKWGRYTTPIDCYMYALR